MTIADTIASIIAKADSTTSPDEATAFMSKDNKMLKQHGLSLLDLGKLSEYPVDATGKRLASSVSVNTQVHEEGKEQLRLST